MRDFKTLVVWRKVRQLVLEVYRITADFPQDERFGLTNQIRRSCASIPTNIAEGCGRSGDKELARFSQIAMGSASELEYQLLLANDLGYFQEQEYLQLNELLVEVKKMLNAFIQRLREER